MARRCARAQMRCWRSGPAAGQALPCQGCQGPVQAWAGGTRGRAAANGWRGECHPVIMRGARRAPPLTRSRARPIASVAASTAPFRLPLIVLGPEEARDRLPLAGSAVRSPHPAHPQTLKVRRLPRPACAAAPFSSAAVVACPAHSPLRPPTAPATAATTALHRRSGPRCASLASCGTAWSCCACCTSPAPWPPASALQRRRTPPPSPASGWAPRRSGWQKRRRRGWTLWRCEPACPPVAAAAAAAAAELIGGAERARDLCNQLHQQLEAQAAAPRLAGAEAAGAALEAGAGGQAHGGRWPAAGGWCGGWCLQDWDGSTEAPPAPPLGSPAEQSTCPCPRPASAGLRPALAAVAARAACKHCLRLTHDSVTPHRPVPAPLPRGRPHWPRLLALPAFPSRHCCSTAPRHTHTHTHTHTLPPSTPVKIQGALLAEMQRGREASRRRAPAAAAARCAGAAARRAGAAVCAHH